MNSRNMVMVVLTLIIILVLIMMLEYSLSLPQIIFLSVVSILMYLWGLSLVLRSGRYGE